jgi:hypothetical protein
MIAALYARKSTAASRLHAHHHVAECRQIAAWLRVHPPISASAIAWRDGSDAPLPDVSVQDYLHARIAPEEISKVVVQIGALARDDEDVLRHGGGLPGPESVAPPKPSNDHAYLSGQLRLQSPDLDQRVLGFERRRRARQRTSASARF